MEFHKGFVAAAHLLTWQFCGKIVTFLGWQHRDLGESKGQEEKDTWFFYILMKGIASQGYPKNPQTIGAPNHQFFLPFILSFANLNQNKHLVSLQG